MGMRVFRAKGYQSLLRELHAHSVATAHIAKIICYQTTMSGEYAFLCGILHDLGTVGALLALGDVPKGKKVPNLEGIWPSIDEIHEESSGILAKLWGLPAEIEMVISHHHTVVIDGYPHPLAATICLAEHLAHEFGVGVSAPIDSTPVDVLEMCARELGITDSLWKIIRRDIRHKLEQISFR
jgi:HD-like signal output (HDOD) protein